MAFGGFSGGTPYDVTIDLDRLERKMVGMR